MPRSRPVKTPGGSIDDACQVNVPTPFALRHRHPCYFSLGPPSWHDSFVSSFSDRHLPRRPEASGRHPTDGDSQQRHRQRQRVREDRGSSEHSHQWN
jgi:hypothetical protein